MVLLTIDFQSGFSDDTVIVQINGETMFRKKNVNTDYSIGRADSVEIPVSKEEIEVDVNIKSRKLSKEIKLEMSAKIYLGVSIDENEVCFKVSEDMFIYF